jgi:hypothetical protein
MVSYLLRVQASCPIRAVPTSQERVGIHTSSRQSCERIRVRQLLEQSPHGLTNVARISCVANYRTVSASFLLLLLHLLLFLMRFHFPPAHHISIVHRLDQLFPGTASILCSRAKQHERNTLRDQDRSPENICLHTCDGPVTEVPGGFPTEQV